MIDTWLDWILDFFTGWLIIFYLCIMCYFCLISVQLSFVHTVYMHEHSPFSYTLIRSLPDDPEFVRLDIRCFILLIRCSMRLDMLQGARFSFYLFWYYCLPFHSYWFCSFPDSLYIAISRYSFFVFMWYHVWAFICSIVVILIDFL